MDLTKHILKHANHISFHTPSHGNNLNKDLLRCDTTELPYSDNLLYPQGILQALQQQIAQCYGAKHCFISTQGATSSIMTAIYATKNLGALLIVGNAHISVFNSARLFGITTYHVDEINQDTTITEDIKTAIITSPDYFGQCAPLQQICQILHNKNITVIVDASHGSHFVFSDKLPVSATEYADLVIYSLHKTLSVATGGSALLAKTDKFFHDISIARSMLHSSSPSYFVLCSISDAFKHYQKNGAKIYNRIFSAINKFVDNMPLPFEVAKTHDFTRLVINMPYCGDTVYNLLAKQNIFAEMSYQNCIVFIVNQHNYKHLPLLLSAFKQLSKQKLPTFEPLPFACPKNWTVAPLNFAKDYEVVPINQANGRKLYKEIGFYPPGVPVFYSNHLLNQADIDLIAKYSKSLFGLDNGMVCVVK